MLRILAATKLTTNIFSGLFFYGADFFRAEIFPGRDFLRLRFMKPPVSLARNEDCEKSDRTIPKNKMSKKARTELNKQKRTTWEMSPVTRVKASKKVYNRKRLHDPE